MADKKISALPAATTPLAGTEVLPVVQGGTTDQVSVANLTAGRDVATKNVTTTSGRVQVNFDGSAGAPMLDLRNSSGTQWELYTPTSDNSLKLDVWVPGQRDSVFSIQNAAGSHNITVSTGNVVIGTAGKGIDFSANGGDILSQYDESTFTPVWNGGSITVGLSKVTRIGRNVVWIFDITFGASVVVATSTLTLPFPCVDAWGAGSINFTDVGATLFVNLDGSADTLGFRLAANAANVSVATLATKRVVGMAIYNA